MKYELEGHCYVLIQTNKIHPIAYDRFDFIWYPERSMTMLETINYRPYVQSIVTENPWLIALYDRSKVRVWDAEDKRWVGPDCQTYGASVNHLMCSVLGLRNTIPAQVMDGGEELEKYIKKLEKSY